MLNKELIHYNDKLYWVYRKVKQSQIKENHINDVKDMWMCDLVLRSKHQDETQLIFVREIEEAEIVRDII
jgi:hypothetical protein